RGSQVRSNDNVQLRPVIVRIVDRHADIDAHHADRRAPAQAEARAGARVESGAVEGVAGIHERGHAPVAREVVLDGGAGDQQALAADHQSVTIARSDRLVCIAADRTVAACEEAQLRWQLAEVRDAGDARVAAQDQAIAAADRVYPRDVGQRLRKARVDAGP